MDAAIREDMAWQSEETAGRYRHVISQAEAADEGDDQLFRLDYFGGLLSPVRSGETHSTYEDEPIQRRYDIRLPFG